MTFCIDLEDESAGARGYVLELYEGHFTLPGLGPIGANGLANPRDFETPTASYENVAESHTLVNKFMGTFGQAELDHSPFDVVAWHGNYAPYKYDLRKFVCMNSVTVDVRCCGARHFLIWKFSSHSLVQQALRPSCNCQRCLLMPHSLLCPSYNCESDSSTPINCPAMY